MRPAVNPFVPFLRAIKSLIIPPPAHPYVLVGTSGRLAHQGNSNNLHLALWVCRNQGKTQSPSLPSELPFELLRLAKQEAICRDAGRIALRPLNLDYVFIELAEAAEYVLVGIGVMGYSAPWVFFFVLGEGAINFLDMDGDNRPHAACKGVVCIRYSRMQNGKRKKSRVSGCGGLHGVAPIRCKPYL
jgi:hypothetical protein